MIGQTIFREKHRERFLTVDRAKFSSRLSAEALGVHDYLLSKPDDWIICEAHIRNRFGWGRKKYQKVMRELRSAGYLQLQPIQSAVGRFVGTKYVLFEKAQPEDAASKSLCLDSEKVAYTERSLLSPGGKGGSIENNDLRLNKDYPPFPRDQAEEKTGGHAQAQQFDDEEDAERAALVLRGQDCGEVFLAFDTKSNRPPIIEKPQQSREDVPPKARRFKQFRSEITIKNNGQKRGSGIAMGCSSPRNTEGVSQDDLDRFERFVAAWQFMAGRENIDAAKRAFLSLSALDQELCIKAAEALQIPPERRVFAVTFIRQRQWAFQRKGANVQPCEFTNPLKGQAVEHDAIPLPNGQIFLKPGSPELSAWEEWERRQFGKAKGGCFRPTLRPPTDDS